MNKWIKSLFKTVFIGISIDDDEVNVSITSYKKGKLLHQEHKSYLLVEGALPHMLFDLLEKWEEKNPYCYVGILLNSINQGAIPGCGLKDFESFQVQKAGSAVICIDEHWALYAAHSAIDELLKEFSKVGGLDFVFSGTALTYFYAKKYLTDEKMLFTFLQKTGITVCVLNCHGLWYSEYFACQLESKKRDNEENEEPIDDLSGELFSSDIQLDDIDLDLDAPLSDNSAVNTLTTNDSGGGSELLYKELMMFGYLKEACERYYKNEHFDSTFLENGVIFDAAGVGMAIKGLMEEELFLTIQWEEIQSERIIADMVKAEVVG